MSVLVGGFRAALALALVAAALAPAGFARARASARIVSLTPAVTETLYAIGAGPEVAGVSNYCDYPPAAMRLPRVGSFLMPNVEAIAALRPTLIIGANLSSYPRGIATLQAMGYPAITVGDNSIEEIEQSIERIGRATGHAAQAMRVRESVEQKIAEIRARLAKLRPRTVLMVVGHQPMVAAGAGSYLDELLSLAGGINIADRTGGSWPRISIEFVVAMKPEVIMDGQMGTDPSMRSSFWSQYATIPAVRNHRVYGYPQDPTLHPGPRIGEALEIIAERIQPQAFSTPIYPADSSLK